jgi:hypothetical protein
MRLTGGLQGEFGSSDCCGGGQAKGIIQEDSVHAEASLQVFVMGVN